MISGAEAIPGRGQRRSESGTWMEIVAPPTLKRSLQSDLGFTYKKNNLIDAQNKIKMCLTIVSAVLCLASSLLLFLLFFSRIKIRGQRQTRRGKQESMTARKPPIRLITQYLAPRIRLSTDQGHNVVNRAVTPTWALEIKPRRRIKLHKVGQVLVLGRQGREVGIGNFEL